MSGDEEKLNPQITSVYIGTRNLRKVVLYPMAMADQKEFGSIFQKTLEEYFNRTTESESISQEDLLPFIADLKGIIGDNMLEILRIVSDLEKEEVDKFFREATTLQVTEIVNKVVEANFEDPLKNLQSLFEKGMNLYEQFQLKRQLLAFLSDTTNTTSDTSTEEASEKED